MGSDAARSVRAMFAEISPCYDFLNHLLSLNLDRQWRRRLVREGLSGLAARERPDRPARVLDLAAGTGDLAIAFRRRAVPPVVVGADFCLPMLRRAIEKGERACGPGAVDWVAADALALPFRDGAFDVVGIAFGLRNFADLGAALLEVRRVLAAGGCLLALEFSMELSRPFGAVYRPYLRHVVARLGGWVSRSGAYRYLDRTVEAFPAPRAVAARLADAGFAPSEPQPLSGGSVTLYRATAL